MDPRLFEAARAGDVAMLQRILQDDPTALHRVVTTSNGEIPLHIAAVLGHSEFVRAVLAGNPALARDCNEQGSSPLHLAAENGHLQVVEELLKVGNDLCLLRDNGGRFPLHVAALKGRADVLAKLINEKPGSIRELTDGGDTVLHLNVKANQFQVAEFLMRRTDANDLMSSRKQVQTTRHVLSRPGIDVNARGATALAVLLESHREHGDVQLQQAAGGKLERSPSLAQSHVIQIHTAASSLRPSSWKRKKKHIKWLSDTRSTLMVVAILIATITFQAAMNPPGGYYLHTPNNTTSNNGTQLSSSSPHHAFEYRDGQAIIGNTAEYNSFMLCDMIGLSASLGIILLLTLIPLRRKLLMAILVRVMLVAILATAMAYYFLALLIIPSENFLAVRMLLVFGQAWVFITIIALSYQLVQGVTWLLKKLGLKMNKMYNAILFVIISLSLYLIW